MANYNAYSRTNYFKVTDVEKLKEIVKKIGAEFWVDDQNPERYGFGDYGCITSYSDNDDGEFDTAEQIQKILPDNEVAVIMEVGYEKLRYLNSFAIIITKKEIKCLDFFTQIEEVYKSLGANNFRISY